MAIKLAAPVRESLALPIQATLGLKAKSNYSRKIPAEAHHFSALKINMFSKSLQPEIPSIHAGLESSKLSPV